MGKVKYFDTQKIVTDGFDDDVDDSLYTELTEQKWLCKHFPSMSDLSTQEDSDR